MLRLALILHVFIGATLCGVGVIAALVMGYTSAAAILVGAGLGFVAALPVSWAVAKSLYN
ncbi:CTP synthetase [Epibacterium sp. SM1979]|uniref:CTP synthetase n=1 Tax=Tritonibacter litoralis TaxID=2662264 RepID=A0A843YFN0_9RHOB|nr:CTP synthetase [Tritonibacter litoralis]MQQ07909.1 CTP synthetase [Tritonibacter litoralis]